jgi:hypothetical protein
MKKLLTLIAIFVSISVHAQFKVDTYKNYMGRWNKYTKEYDLDNEYRYANISFTFYDSYIQANDEAKSIYRLTKNLPDDVTSKYKSVSMECLDENNKECRFTVMKDNTTGQVFVVIQYTILAYFYVVKTD